MEIRRNNSLSPTDLTQCANMVPDPLNVASHMCHSAKSRERSLYILPLSWEKRKQNGAFITQLVYLRSLTA